MERKHFIMIVITTIVITIGMTVLTVVLNKAPVSTDKSETSNVMVNDTNITVYHNGTWTYDEETSVGQVTESYSSREEETSYSISVSFDQEYCASIYEGLETDAENGQIIEAHYFISPKGNSCLTVAGQLDENDDIFYGMITNIKNTSLYAVAYSQDENALESFKSLDFKAEGVAGNHFDTSEDIIYELYALITSSGDTLGVTLEGDDTGILSAIAIASEGKTDINNVIYPLIAVGNGKNENGLPIYIFEHNETSKFYMTSYNSVSEVPNTEDGTLTITRDITVMGPVDIDPDSTEYNVSTKDAQNSARVKVIVTMKDETIENISFNLVDYTGNTDILKEIAPAILY